MDKKNGENYELVKRHFDKVVLPSPDIAVLKTVFVEIMMNDVAIALQQNNSYEKQNYAKNHSSVQTLRPDPLSLVLRQALLLKHLC
jgi:hypothetical protein